MEGFLWKSGTNHANGTRKREEQEGGVERKREAERMRKARRRGSECVRGEEEGVDGEVASEPAAARHFRRVLPFFRSKPRTHQRISIHNMQADMKELLNSE